MKTKPDFLRTWIVRPFNAWLRALLALGLLLPAAARALDPTGWAQRQPFNVAAPGLVRLNLPPATLDQAQPDLADLRVLDPAGRETPYALRRSTMAALSTRAPRQFQTSLNSNATVLTMEVGTLDKDTSLLAITLATPGAGFIKPVRIELSNNGSTWEMIADGVPIFRQNGATGLTLQLPRRPAAWVRLTVDDRRSPPVAFTGATLLTGPTQAAPTEPTAVQIVARDELPGETVLTLDLGAAHLALTSLRFITDEPLFTRQLTFSARELQQETVVEHELAHGTIYRVALEGLPPAASLDVPVHLTTATRELIVHIDNGDSPPLALTAVTAARLPVGLVFNAPAPGAYTLLLGSPSAIAPRYDVQGAISAMATISAGPVVGPLEPNPDYHRPETLANVALEGAPLDPQGWAWRKPVKLTAAGVQQLELDQAVLTQSRPDYSDLRLLLAGHQVPYLIEQTSLKRPVPLAAVAEANAERPSLSRWQIKLPLAGLPLTRLTLTSNTALFQRQMRLYETVSDERGTERESTLATAEWTHTPDRPAGSLTLILTSPPHTDTLRLETDNGNNPPLALTGVTGWTPVVRILFKGEPQQAPALYYGQPEAATPRYDLSLVANQLFAAVKIPAILGPAESLNSNFSDTYHAITRSNWLLWVALTLVVVLLLVVIARLLPKPPAA